MENKDNQLNNNLLIQQKDEDYIIKAYEHINDMYKFYINLRFIILGAALGVLSYILTNFANNTAPINDYKRILIFLGIGTCIIFFLMDYRTKILFRESRAAGQKIEEQHMKVVGFYTYMTNIDKAKKGFKTRFGLFFSHSRIISISYLFILGLFLYLLIISFIV